MDKSFKITAWVYIKDEMEPVNIGCRFPTLEDAQIAAQAFYFNRSRKPYSMSVECGDDVWKWKPGRTWELQINIKEAIDVTLPDKI